MKEICSAATNILKENFDEESKQISEFLYLCESPVEQILVATLYNQFGMSVNSHYQRLQSNFTHFPEFEGIFTLVIELQKNITSVIWERDYRADLFLYLTRFWVGEKSPLWGKIIVEVDGHDFHDRTKEQASRDRQRDRDLLTDGYKTVRFTGSDVYNDPYRCVEEIEFIMANEAMDTFLYYLNSERLEELLVGQQKIN